MQATVNSSGGSSGPPQKAADINTSRRFLLVSIFCLGCSILGCMALSPLCQTNDFDWKSSYYHGNYFPFACVVMYAGTIHSICFAFISACLLYAGRYQLSNVDGQEAGNCHFNCMFIWVIILSSLNLVQQSAWVAPFASAAYPTAGLGGCMTAGDSDYWYYCYSILCQRDKELWKTSVCNWEKEHAGGTMFFILTNWLLWGYTIYQIIAASQTKYWCCDTCKRDCKNCGSPCCAIPPGGLKGSQPVQQLAVGGGVQMGVPAQATQVLGDTKSWLVGEMNLPQYVDAFVQTGYDSMQAVVAGIVTEADLRRVVPDILPGHVALMLSSISSKRGGGAYTIATEGTVTR